MAKEENRLTVPLMERAECGKDIEINGHTFMSANEATLAVLRLFAEEMKLNERDCK